METPGRARPVSRAAAILFRPSRTWEVAAAEPASARAILLGYVAPLAAIPAVCRPAGALLFGFNVANVGVRQSAAGVVLEALAVYLATLAAVWLLAQATALLAPAFGGVRDRAQALKLIAYSGTAWWVAGVFELYPSLGFPASILGGIYSLYALHEGLPKLMRAPQDRALTYFAAVLLAVLAAGAGVGALAAWAAELGGPLSYTSPPR